MVREITSPLNALFKQLLALEKTRGIKKYGKAIISGEKLVREILEDFPGLCLALISTKQHQLPDIPGGYEIDLYYLAPELFERIDFHGTDSPLALIKALPFSDWDIKDQVKGCSLCIPFQDPANVGAVIRSACAFGVSRIIILQEAANPLLPKATRASAGSVFRAPLFNGPSIHDLSSQVGVPTVALSQHGVPIEGFEFPESFYLVPGMEGPGLPPGIEVTHRVSIPMEEGVESLNAAVATSIALYLWRTRMGTK